MNKWGEEIVATQWLDARELDADLDMQKAIKKMKSGKELLVLQTTYGKVMYLKDVVLIKQEEDNTGSETITVVPIGWIVE